MGQRTSEPNLTDSIDEFFEPMLGDAIDEPIDEEPKVLGKNRLAELRPAPRNASKPSACGKSWTTWTWTGRTPKPHGMAPDHRPSGHHQCQQDEHPLKSYAQHGQCLHRAKSPNRQTH